MIYNNTVLIPSNYWEGNHTLDLEIPWITPGALHSLFLFLKPHHNVLEFGSGGSTLFFSNQVRNVLSFETLAPWYEKIKLKLIENKRENISLHFVKTVEECLNVIGVKKFDVILVDCCELSRYDLTKLSMDMINPGGIIVVDNYSAPYCFNLDELFVGKLQAAFDDSHWAGSGTKIYYF